MTALPRRTLATVSTLLLTLAMTVPPALADVTARISQPKVAFGDSFTLQLQATGQQGAASPDLAPLEKDFSIGATGQSSSTSVINGAVSQSHGWSVTLTPKEIGHFDIPPIAIGSETTQTLAVEVVDPASLPRVDLADTGLQVDVSLPDGPFYVQQEIPVTVRIMAATPLHNAELSEPASDDVIVSRTGEDRTSRDTVDGKPVTVIERTYLVKPQKSGALSLPPVTLRAIVDDPAAPSSRFPANDMFAQMQRQFGFSGFASSMFDDLMRPGREVIARSEPIRLDIKPRPGANATWFLPAKKVDLVSKWDPERPTFKVGAAATRIVQIVVLGASKEQLPDLAFDDVDGAQVYVDRVDDTSADTGNGTAAVKQYMISVVPTRPGKLVLPEISLRWLDTGDGTEKTATIAAETVEVAGAPASAAAPAAPAAGPGGAPDDAVASTTPPVRSARDWPVAAYGAGAGAALLLLAVSAGVWLRRRRGARASVAEERAGDARNEAAAQSAAAALRAACGRNDAWQANASLNAWFAARGMTRRALSGAAAARFEAAAQDLEARCYGADPKGGAWNGSELRAAFDALQRDVKRHNRRKGVTGALPPLYGMGTPPQDHPPYGRHQGVGLGPGSAVT